MQTQVLSVEYPLEEYLGWNELHWILLWFDLAKPQKRPLWNIILQGPENEPSHLWGRKDSRSRLCTLHAGPGDMDVNAQQPEQV